MASQQKVLFVLSSQDKFESIDRPTGWYLQEFAHPYNVLAPHFQVVVASPRGGKAPLDPSSIDAAKDDKEATEFLHTKDALWANTIPLSSVIDKASEFAAVYFVGGHGPMFDLAKSSESAQLVKNFDAAGKVVAAVCHGPAALTHPDLSDFLKGENVTGFSNSEENAVEMSDKVPFLLEDRLKEMGTKYSKGDDWSDYVVVSKGGRLVTGQNPASAAGVAKKVLEKVQG